MWIQCKIKWMRLNNIIIIVEKTTHVIKNIMHVGILLCCEYNSYKN